MVRKTIRLQVRRAAAGDGAVGRSVRGLLLAASLLGGERAAVARTEPGLAAVQRAALVHAGLSPGATNRLLLREHLSALLPQVRVTLGRGWQLSATGRPLDGLTAPTTVDDDHTSYAVSASWDLARLLVPHEALPLHNAEPRLAAQRLAVLVRVSALFAARCHLLQQGQAGAAERGAELEAGLDLLTGGHKLPAVTAETTCPAVPRFTVALPRPSSAPRASTTSRHRTSGAEPGDAGDYGDDARLPEAGFTEAPEYGYE